MPLDTVTQTAMIKKFLTRALKLHPEYLEISESLAAAAQAYLTMAGDAAIQPASGVNMAKFMVAMSTAGIDSKIKEAAEKYGTESPVYEAVRAQYEEMRAPLEEGMIQQANELTTEDMTPIQSAAAFHTFMVAQKHDSFTARRLKQAILAVESEIVTVWDVFCVNPTSLM